MCCLLVVQTRWQAKFVRQMQGMESYCIRAFAEALEVIPYTLAENAGLNPIEMVTELRNRHAQGDTAAGINVRKGQITNMLEENVVQPLLVTTSAVNLACECVRMILKVNRDLPIQKLSAQQIGPDQPCSCCCWVLTMYCAFIEDHLTCFGKNNVDVTNHLQCRTGVSKR